MKKFPKIILASGVTLMLGAGSVSAYLQAQPKEQLSDLTLANIEALAEEENIGGDARWIVTPLDNYGSKQCDPGGSEHCTF